VTDHDAIEAMGLSKKRIMELVVQASATQIFIHGDVHADPHPGLLLVPGWPDVAEIRRGRHVAKCEHTDEVSLLY
jgi:predicted unusual protein kinase regulating ubiquinone biosynthesis (AarF/ABC1/UbiB family)